MGIKFQLSKLRRLSRLLNPIVPTVNDHVLYSKKCKRAELTSSDVITIKLQKKNMKGSPEKTKGCKLWPGG